MYQTFGSTFVICPSIPRCKECDCTELVEDYARGEVICTNCGLVVESQPISMEAEYRVFSSDPTSKNKIRVGAAYNPLREHTLTEYNRLASDGKEFLREGMREIEDVLIKCYHGEIPNAPVKARAEELFEAIFHYQLKQKEGKIEMKKAANLKTKTTKRLKFSKKKQFVAACLHKAFKEHRVSRWDCKVLAQMIDHQMSTQVVNKCLKELDTASAIIYDFATHPKQQSQM